MTAFFIEALNLPLKSPFRISRGVKDKAELVRVTLKRSGKVGRGECCPYSRYGESPEKVIAALEGVRKSIERGAGLLEIQDLLPSGAARNALDCALYDLEAGLTGRPVYKRLGLEPPGPFKTFRTITIDTPENMAKAAAQFAPGTPLKVKLDRDLVRERLSAVRKAAPESDLLVDANEGWDVEFLNKQMPGLVRLKIAAIEQPVPAGKDSGLSEIQRPVPVLADEACHGAGDLDRLLGKYDAVNIKLDKTGGLTGALDLLEAAKRKGFRIMLGCMVSSSLSIAPIAQLCSHADYIDLDGPLLLKSDPDRGLAECKGTAEVELTHPWGSGKM